MMLTLVISDHTSREHCQRESELLTTLMDEYQVHLNSMHNFTWLII